VGQKEDEIERSPEQIREAISQARSDLGEHLRALSEPPFPSGDEKMAVHEKRERTVAKSDKQVAKSETKTKTKSSGAKSKKATPARIVKGAAATAGHVLDTMAAGAVVGAVKAAAQAITEQEAKSPKGKRKTSPSTGEVLSEMAPDAAVGAIAGAAHSVLPEGGESDTAKPKGAKATKAKGGSTRKK